MAEKVGPIYLAPFVLLLFSITGGTEETMLTPSGVQNKKELSWEIFADFDGHFFPSFVLATTDTGKEREHSDLLRLGEAGEHIGAYVKSPDAGVPVTVIVRAGQFFKEARALGVLKKARTEYLITPKLVFDRKALLSLRREERVEVTVALQVSGKSLGEKKREIIVHPLEDVLLNFSAGEDQSYDFSSTLAAFVNENHQAVRSLLERSLTSQVVERFDGYTRKSPEAALMQAYAIWDTLEKDGRRYAQERPAPQANDKLIVRKVRALDEAVSLKEGSCMDGSILMASALQKTGLHPSLALMPDSVLVVFDLDDEGSAQAALDMTLLGQPQREPDTEIEKFSLSRISQLKDKASWKTFSASIHTGSDAFHKAEKHLFEQSDQGYQLVDIAEARFNGIKPLF